MCGYVDCTRTRAGARCSHHVVYVYNCSLGTADAKIEPQSMWELSLQLYIFCIETL